MTGANNGRWQFEKVGLGYHCWAPEIQTDFHANRIRRSHGDLTGEVRVVTNILNVKTQGDGTLHHARLNFLSSTARATLTRVLEKRTAAAGHDMDWYDGIEALCQGIILAEQLGEPVLEFNETEVPSYHDLFLVEPLVLKGQPSLLYGPGGVGKSLIALACALSVSAGREIIPGIAPSIHANALYLDWETSPEVIHRRLQAIGAGHGFNPFKGFFYRHCVRPLADEVEELAAIVAEKDIALVVVDSAAQAMGTQGEYGDANEGTLRLHAALRLMKTSPQVIDHVGKSDARAKAGTATPYGSAYKGNQTRMAWETRKANVAGGMGVNLYHFKGNDSPDLPPIGIALDWEDGKIVFHSSGPLEQDEDLTISEDTGDLVRELLEDGEEMQIGAIASALTTPSRKDNTIRTTVYRMAKRGEITKTDSGGYKLTNMVRFPTSS